MDKNERTENLAENLGKVSAGIRNEDPAVKNTEHETEIKKDNDKEEPSMLEKLGKTQAGAVYEDPAMKETEEQTEKEKEE
ncbi:MAG: hypothetical protein ACTH9D_08030 [Enterococcus viikkiensis]